jgi:hypothetical protein
MPDRHSIELLEMKKRFALMERNMLSATQNINILTIELEKMRNFLASKEGFEDLVGQQAAAPAPPTNTNNASSSSSSESRRGPVNSKTGRTLKVINN